LTLLQRFGERSLDILPTQFDVLALNQRGRQGTCWIL